MSQTKTPEEQIKDLQAQVALLTAQTTALTGQQQLLSAQIALQVLQQTTQAAIDKGTLDKLKDLIVSQTALDKAKAAEPFAELQGIKEGLSGLAVTGKEGTIGIGKGADGALLLRVKKEMLESLDAVAKEIIKALPADNTAFVLATNADAEAAYKSEVLLERLAIQKGSLDAALRATLPKPPPSVVPGVESLPALAAAVHTVPFFLNLLSDAGKFFRVDRAISIFDAGEDAKRILESFIEAHAHRSTTPRISRIDNVTDDVVTQGKSFLTVLNQLKALYDQAFEQAGGLQRATDEAAKVPAGQPKPVLPSPEALARLKGEVASTKALLDAFNPSTNPESFWAQVAGQIKKSRLMGRGRIHLAAIAQTVQTFEKRVWRSDRLVGAGDVQVEYRITNANGEYLGSGIKLYTSATRNIFEDDAAHATTLPAFEVANPLAKP